MFRVEVATNVLHLQFVHLLSHSKEAIVSADWMTTKRGQVFYVTYTVGAF